MFPPSSRKALLPQSVCSFMLKKKKKTKHTRQQEVEYFWLQLAAWDKRKSALSVVRVND